MCVWKKWSLFGSELLIVLPSCLCPELFLSHLKPCLTYFLFMALGLDGVCLRALQLPLIQTTALWGFVLFFSLSRKGFSVFPWLSWNSVHLDGFRCTEICLFLPPEDWVKDVLLHHYPAICLFVFETWFH